MIAPRVAPRTLWLERDLETGESRLSWRHPEDPQPPARDHAAERRIAAMNRNRRQTREPAPA